MASGEVGVPDAALSFFGVIESLDACDFHFCFPPPLSSVLFLQLLLVLSTISLLLASCCAIIAPLMLYLLTTRRDTSVKSHRHKW